jgi:hypothetical protein
MTHAGKEFTLGPISLFGFVPGFPDFRFGSLATGNILENVEPAIILVVCTPYLRGKPANKAVSGKGNLSL